MRTLPPIAVLLFTVAAAATAHANADTRLPDDTVIAAGTNTAYLIKPDASVWAWGSNTAGQIGDGSQNNRLKPVSISAGCAQITSGEAFALCINQDASLWSWGINGFGQLGRTGSIYSPAQVGGESDWRTVEAGFAHALAIKYDGTLYSWGGNGSGQLGLNDTTKRSTPTKVGSDTDWMAIAAGSHFSLALKANGKLYGCGLNTSGQLGNGGTAAGPKTFTQIGTDRWRAISAGIGHVLAIREDGTLWTWGQNDSYQVGNNSNAVRTTPYQITNASSWRAVSAGGLHSMAISSDGKLWGWGGNTKGELGMGNNTSPKKTPGQVGSSRWHQYVAAGTYFTLALMADGTVKTWGEGISGQLGINSTANKNTPQQPWVSYDGDEWAYGNKVQVPGAGSYHSLLISRRGTVETWGSNLKGQLGDGTTNNSSNGNWYPTARNADTDWMVATGGENCSHAIKSDGTLWVWGTNNNGEMGTTSVPKDGVKASPYKVGTNSTWLKAQAHYAQMLALRADGTMYGSGDNFGGLLGVDSADANIFTLTKVKTDSGKYWAAMAVSERNSYAIRTDGTLWAAGANGQKQLGVGGTANANGTKVFVQVGTLTDWVAVGAGTDWGVAVRADGRAYTWGNNTGGVLGQESAAALVSTPQLVHGGYRIRLLGTTRFAAIGRGAWGNVIGWGSNPAGELGVGSATGVAYMQQTSFWGSRFIAGGAAHFVESNTFSWNGFAAGDGTSGQIGDGAQTSRYWPASINY